MDKFKFNMWRIMKRADYDYKRGVGPISLCLKNAWELERFEKRLSTNVVRFSYWKEDPTTESGKTIREALGTKVNFLIPGDKKPKNPDAIPNYKVITYFDLEKQEWRSCKFENLIGFVTCWPEDQPVPRKSKNKGSGNRLKEK